MSNLMVFCIRFFGVLLFGLVCVEAFGLPKEVKVIEGRDLDLGQYSSIAVDADGHYVVVFYNATDQDLMVYFSKNDSVVVLDSEGDAGKYATLALNESSDEALPVIAYLADNNIRLLVCQDAFCETSKVRDLEEVESIANFSKLNVSVINSNQPVVYYHNKIFYCQDSICTNFDSEVSNGIVGVYGDAGNILKVEIKSFPFIPEIQKIFLYECGITVACEDKLNSFNLFGFRGEQRYSFHSSDFFQNKKGNYSASYIFKYPNNPILAEHLWLKFDNVSKNIETDFFIGASEHNATAINENEDVFFINYDSVQKHLKFSANYEEPIILDDIDSTSFGKYNDIAILEDGNPIISFYDEANKDLVIVSCSDISCDSYESLRFKDKIHAFSSDDIKYGFNIKTLEINKNILIFSFREKSKNSIIGVKEVAFGLSVLSKDNMNLFQSRILLAKKDSELETLIESFEDLAFSSNKYGDIFYLSSSEVDFSEIIKDNYIYRVSTLPEDLAIAVSSADLPIVFALNNQKQLIAKNCDDENCNEYSINRISSNIEASNAVAEHNINGYPALSFYDTKNNKLKLVICDENCVTSKIIEIDEQQNPAAYLSLKLNQHNAPILSFYDEVKKDLKLLVCENEQCDNYSLNTIVKNGNTGLYTSLELDDNNNPLIFYQNADTNQLKLAICNTPTCNTPPILKSNFKFTLPTIQETLNPIQARNIKSILFSDGANPIIDPDHQAQQGMAIIAADQTNGRWQYSTDGQTYLDLPFDVSETNAVLLADTARIRFKPNPNYHGQATFRFRAWDQTAGENGATGQDLSNPASFISSAVSQASDTVTLTLTPIADQPNVTPPHAVAKLGQPNTSGLVITRHAADGQEVTHFKITSIEGGELFKHDGITRINNNSFITVAEGNAGLKFIPNTPEGGRFRVYASLSDKNDGVGREFEIAYIGVDLPIVEIRTEGTLSEDTPEETAEFIFNLSLSAPAEEGLTVYYQVIENSNNAILNEDYKGNLTAGKLHFAVRENQKRITVQAIDDDRLDGDKALQLSLISTPPNSTQRPRYTVSDTYNVASFVIEDNDAPNSPPYFKPKLSEQVLNQLDNSTMVAVDNTVTFVINAIDNEAHLVNFNFIDQLPGATSRKTVNPNEIQIEWTPSQVGQYQLTIELIEETGKCQQRCHLLS